MSAASSETLLVGFLVCAIGLALARLTAACLSRRERAAGGLDVVVTTALLVWTAGVVGLTGTWLTDGDPTEAATLAIAVGSTGAGGLASAAYVVARVGRSQLGLGRPQARGLVLGLAGIPLFLGLSAAWVAGLELLGIEVPPQQLLTLVQDEETRQVLVFALAYGTLGAPLAEELIFRGMFLQVLQRHASPAGALLIQGLAFGLVHVADPAAVVPLAVLGVGLGWLRLHTNNLWPCIVLHAGNNAFALLLAALGLLH